MNRKRLHEVVPDIALFILTSEKKGKSTRGGGAQCSRPRETILCTTVPSAFTELILEMFYIHTSRYHFTTVHVYITCTMCHQQDVAHRTML